MLSVGPERLAELRWAEAGADGEVGRWTIPPPAPALLPAAYDEIWVNVSHGPAASRFAMSGSAPAFSADTYLLLTVASR